jgi:hypothetical protein
MIGVLYMLPSGKQIIQSSLKGAAFGLGVPAGKAVYDRATGGGSADNKDEYKKDEDQKDGEKKENDKNKGTSSEDANGNGSGGNSESKTVTG